MDFYYFFLKWQCCKKWNRCLSLKLRSNSPMLLRGGDCVNPTVEALRALSLWDFGSPLSLVSTQDTLRTSGLLRKVNILYIAVNYKYSFYLKEITHIFYCRKQYGSCQTLQLETKLKYKQSLMQIFYPK